MIDINLSIHKALSFDGFGRLIRQLTEAMLLSGKFDVHPYLMEQLEWPGFLQNAAGLDHSRLTMFLCPPNWIKKPAPSRTWLYAMHESTQLPEGWADLVNQVERLVVPCSWCEEVYRGSGVTIPISVVNPGVDFNECALLPPVRKGARPFTFLALGDRGIRKGWWLSYAAFFKAFRKDDHVSLIIKSNLGNGVPDILAANRPYEGLQGRVRVWSERVPNMRDVFAQADCIAYPAHGEGWGLFPREAAACGLPVIATNYSGLAVNCEQWAYPLNDYELVPAPGEKDGLPGLWAYPSVDELASQMRWVYEHPDDARAKGQQSAAWLRQNVTWERSIDTLHDVFIGNDRETLKQRQALEIPPDTRGSISIQSLKHIRDQQFEKVNGHAL